MNVDLTALRIDDGNDTGGDRSEVRPRPRNFRGLLLVVSVLVLAVLLSVLVEASERAGVESMRGGGVDVVDMLDL